MPANFLSDLRRLGVEVWAEAGQLRYRAPARTLTHDLRAELAKHKTDLLALLERENGRDTVMEHVPFAIVRPDPDKRHEPFELTDIQHAYWIGRGSGFELGNVATHAYFEFEGAGLEVERVGGAWEQLIARHDMLRAVVKADGQQQILRAVPAYQIAVTDLRTAAAAEVQAQIEGMRERMAHQVYDPAHWPLFEIRAARLPGGRVRVLISIDLLIADVWSLFLLFREWGALYETPGRALAPLTLSFRDYVVAEAALEPTPRYARAQAYWTARLPALRPGPALPLARLPASVARPRFVRRTGRIEAERWQRIKARGQQAGLTPSMVLCAAFTEVLAAWSKEPQFTLNVTLFHRLPLHTEVNAIVGDFTSTVLLAVEAPRTLSLVDRGRRLQQQLWSDLEHRYMSGVRVLRDLARQAGHGPRMAMPVVFTSTLGQESGGTATPTAWLGDLVYGISQTPQVWLDHQVGEDADALVFNWDAVEALFPEGLLDAMFDAYLTRVMQLAMDAEVWEVKTPGLIPEAEVRLQRAINATATPAIDATLPALVAAQVAQRPTHPAVITPTRQLSYMEVGSAAHAVARWLRRQGAKPNRLVAVVMEKGWEQIVAVVGVVQAGGAYLPIEADTPAERLALMLACGEATLVLTQSWLIDTLAWPPRVTHLAVDQWEAIGEGDTRDHQAPQADDLAYVMFTSGSTGVPKGVMLTHRAVVNTLLDINGRWAVGPADRVLALSALSFDLSVYDIFGTLAAGGTVVLPAAREPDPAHWLARLVEARVTVWNTVPALMQLLVETAEATGRSLPDTLRLVLLSGDWIPVPLPDRIRACAPNAQVISLGGATEAAIWSIHYPVGAVDPSWLSIPYGRPLANQTWQVLHPDGTPCPVWVPGELYIGGLGLAAGYWHDPARTAERFVRHPETGERLYRTGDWGRYRPDGDIEFLGRDDLQVKVQGYRIELGEIEAALVRHAGVEQAVVAAHGDRMGEKRLVAYVVGRDTRLPDASALRAWLQTTLPSYMVPATFHVLPALPLTPNGKVDRKALLAMNPTPHAAEKVFIAPRDPLERQLAAIWEDVLGARPIGVTDRFFDLGGNSFLAVRLMVRVQQTLGKTLPVSTLFEADTIDSLARAIRDQQLPSTSTLVRLASGALPAFFCVHPIGGNVICYVDLARCFGEARAFYGIQAVGLHGEAVPFSDVVSMAAYYLEEIRRVQPRGPYLLGGWSMGGTVAFEIALQLEAQREETSLLALIDAETNAIAASGAPAVREPNLLNHMPSHGDPGQLQHLLSVFTNNDRALKAYRERTYSGRVALFRAREQPDGRVHDLGWGDLVAGSLDIHVVPGDHYTMLQRPNVEALAAQLRLCLETAAVCQVDKPGNLLLGGDHDERVSHS